MDPDPTHLYDPVEYADDDGHVGRDHDHYKQAESEPDEGDEDDAVAEFFKKYHVGAKEEEEVDTVSELFKKYKIGPDPETKKADAVADFFKQFKIRPKRTNKAPYYPKHSPPYDAGYDRYGEEAKNDKTAALQTYGLMPAVRKTGVKKQPGGAVKTKVMSNTAPRNINRTGSQQQGVQHRARLTSATSAPAAVKVKQMAKAAGQIFGDKGWRVINIAKADDIKWLSAGVDAYNRDHKKPLFVMAWAPEP
jgi:hypothetical protein